MTTWCRGLGVPSGQRASPGTFTKITAAGPCHSHPNVPVISREASQLGTWEQVPRFLASAASVTTNEGAAGRAAPAPGLRVGPLAAQVPAGCGQRHRPRGPPQEAAPGGSLFSPRVRASGEQGQEKTRRQKPRSVCHLVSDGTSCPRATGSSSEASPRVPLTREGKGRKGLPRACLKAGGRGASWRLPPLRDSGVPSSPRAPSEDKEGDEFPPLKTEDVDRKRTWTGRRKEKREKKGQKHVRPVSTTKPVPVF